MSELDLLRDEIRELEREIEELENEKELDDGEYNFDNMDPLLNTILHEQPQGDLIDGTRIIRSKELDELYNENIEKIQAENVFRLNSITLFPISNDKTNEFIGIRFDVFNAFNRKFTDCHYVILRQMEVNIPAIKGIVHDNDDSIKCKWEVFQSTIPKFIPTGELALRYLNETFFTEVPNIEIPAFEYIHRFAKEVFEELTRFESQKSILLQLQSHYQTNSKVNVQSADLALSKIIINIPPLQTTITIHTSTATATVTGTSKEAQHFVKFCGAASFLSDLKKLAVAVQREIDSFLT